MFLFLHDRLCRKALKILRVSAVQSELFLIDQIVWDYAWLLKRICPNIQVVTASWEARTKRPS